MEGSMCSLRELVALKRRYKFYLFVDEAHSIGAVGPNGKGPCDYFGVDPRDVDILMGTFTKSFGASGGYITNSQDVITKLRTTNPRYNYGKAPVPAVMAQNIASMKTILANGEGIGGGNTRLKQLLWNSRYLRQGLKRIRYTAYGNEDSPVVPTLLLNPVKMLAFRARCFGGRFLSSSSAILRLRWICLECASALQ
ncbi:putative serine palmitoyltransferase 2 [Aspergillus nomiae NRRL 13137]|uniref:serine C-palmitoyltransferase n=1 Tax=Aspergillus nomiae NRRL (strain ATCC 15546 / NRRL 13137 / CBS 260.88 / M93) TaxID=1509407 RepID=A0A0L1IMZ6_ASPN3|nr:putative serine palmitoyltransferase 2 [Aspergillus nomiae NRRL 13137]KNG80862.1 putative serine palmitoyltransferase 2 [Aspergillus nomiae NRRL 13137]